ncbi:hypothetical protein HDA32_005630 [Spinactinospora alkalitolerans]|uniref:Dihydrodiol dehydrogenase n=1 Tax=Spinactinospora alkalitolerans TaxID=687207 RepID=A0A852U989_9ACTN|nr:hypothetical protein [Spinactinospora alkalitolerans]NYE50510.1 hypothetical protein [Spinactinospora alkalitolerans]
MSEAVPIPEAENPGDGEVLHYPRDGGDEGPIVVANEFVDVVVRRVETRNGVRLEIWSPRRNTCVRFDAVALDCLSYQEPEFITSLLARKPGP